MKLRARIAHLLGRKYKKSYSQCGEDIIMQSLLSTLDIKHPSYIEIGTNTPIAKNNTYLFYSTGSRGVCIEPDPLLFKEIQRVRKHDICLNVGIGPSSQESAPYYVMSSKALSTFLKSEADAYVRDQNYGKQVIEQVLHIPLVTINSIMEKYFSTCGNILSIDTEGYDSEILRSLDFKHYRPKVICVETARYEGTALTKETELIDFLKTQDYVVYADTFINSILVDKHIYSFS